MTSPVMALQAPRSAAGVSGHSDTGQHVLARPAPVLAAARAYPPFYAGPARCHHSSDFQSKSGAQRLATIIREAWRACDVIVPLRIEETVVEMPRQEVPRTLYAVRVELVGGLPGRVG